MLKILSLGILWLIDNILDKTVDLIAIQGYWWRLTPVDPLWVWIKRVRYYMGDNWINLTFTSIFEQEWFKNESSIHKCLN